MPAQGATLTEAARLSARATDALRTRELLVGDEPAPRVAGILNAVARPVAQVDVRWARGTDQAELRGVTHSLRRSHRRDETQARDAMRQMRYTRGGSVNPVVDKYLVALAEVGYGEQGSVVMAAESAIAEYQNVIDQLEFIMAGYQNREEAIKDHLGRLQP